MRYGALTRREYSRVVLRMWRKRIRDGLRGKALEFGARSTQVGDYSAPRAGRRRTSERNSSSSAAPAILQWHVDSKFEVR